MPEIDQSRAFVPVNISILTVSDTRTAKDDRSGSKKERIENYGHKVVYRTIVKDEIETIKTTIRKWIKDPAVDVVISTGGTGLTGRDVTPEAFKQIFEKEIEGFGELFRWLSFQK